MQPHEQFPLLYRMCSRLAMIHKIPFGIALFATSAKRFPKKLLQEAERKLRTMDPATQNKLADDVFAAHRAELGL